MTTEGKKLFSLACDITKTQAGEIELPLEYRVAALEERVIQLSNLIDEQIKINKKIIDTLRSFS